MFDRLTIRVRDLEASGRFYELAAVPDEVSLVVDGEPTRNLHVAFGVPTRDDVVAWWQRLVDAGYTSDGEPGRRPEYSPSYYGAFVLDPDGNSVEAVHHQTSPPSGVDHLWLRSRDVGGLRDRYAAVLRLVHDTPERVRFAGEGSGSFSFVLGDQPTKNVAFAFDGVEVEL